MKKWLYFISVGGMTAIFMLFYLSDRKEAHVLEVKRLEIAKQKQAEEAAKKKEDEASARREAEKRDQERRAEEAKKEEDRRRKWDEASKKIQDDTNGFLARADKASKESSSLEIQLDALHKAGEKANREMFDLAKRVERAQSERQAAELEIQRTTEYIARRAADSSLTRMPPPPAVNAAPAR
jgi:hypothetical protein